MSAPFYKFTSLTLLKLPFVMDVYTNLYFIPVFCFPMVFIHSRVDMDTMNVFYISQSCITCSPN